MPDLPELPAGDNMDWTPEQCLEAALEQVRWMRKNHPEGLEGVAILFDYSQDYEQEADEDNPARYYLMSGINTMGFVSICQRASYMRLEATYKISRDVE